MAHPFDQQPHDLGVLQQSPPNQANPTVPLAEEFALGEVIGVTLVERSRRDRGWLQLPELEVSPPRTLNISGGQLLAPAYSTYQLPVSGNITVPALSNSSSVVSQRQKLYAVVFAIEVGGEQDPLLAQVSFKYRQEQADGTVEILDTTKENTRRIRSAWMWLLSSDDYFDGDSFTNMLTLGSNGLYYLSIENKSSSGFNIGAHRGWVEDSTLMEGKTYRVFPQLLNVFPLCEIIRRQNFPERGYIWGSNGEEPLGLDYSIAYSTTGLARESPTDAIARRLREIFSGVPGVGRTFGKAVQNFTAGQVAGNPGRPGETTASPNGSVCLATGQRVTYSNQAWTQDVGVQVITAGNDGSGNALVAMSLDSPVAGTRFSSRRSDHRIYKADGTEQGDAGSFLNLGGSGALTWISGVNSTITSGEIVYAVPAINLPAGSGFSIPFEEITGAWRNSSQVSTVNIRRADSDDLAQYEAPANGEEFIIIYGVERAALHYIYKHITVTSSSTGVLSIPSAEAGCFAFIEGVEGGSHKDPYRIDKPVVTGVTPNTSYQALVYYPPRSNENWQFELRYPFYQGTKEAGFLDGATISAVLVNGYIHSQGGGLSVFQGDAAIALSAIAMHLPSLIGANSYEFDTPAQLQGESYPGPLTIRPFPFLPGAELALPSPGQRLSFVEEGTGQINSLNGYLMADGRRLGFKTPQLNQNAYYQAVLAFATRKGDEERLVIATANGRGGDIEINTQFSDADVAFDTFLM